MCGIVGIASSKRAVTDSDWLALGSSALEHRGPDSQGQWFASDGRVGLAHRRLSIIDLSSAGHQPMLCRANQTAVVFNGEIYNYRELRSELSALGYAFNSESDTEVLLAAYALWGVDCLSRLNGMFAFALYDTKQQKLFLGRDRAGEKPLYYRLENGELRFSSELKAMLCDPHIPKVIEREALDIYLTMGYVPGTRCIVEGFNKLPAASALLFDLSSGDVRRWKYWRLPEYEDPPDGVAIDEKQLVDELEHLLEDSVRRQLVADVPVGVLLSGGVDSSLVTAMAVRASSKVQTFTIGFPGQGVSDETQHAQLIAKHFGTQHTELMADPSNADLIPILARQYDEPIIDSSMIPTYLVSALVQQQCKVALGGDGGDELFGGYGHYRRLLKLKQRSGLFPRKILQLAGSSAGRVLPIGTKGRNWLQGLETDLNESVPLIAKYFDSSIRPSLLANYKDWELVAEKEYANLVPRNSDLVQRATRVDFNTYLAEDILVKVDRASMLSSLELRAPMLDYRIIEFAYSKVPSRLKVTSSASKILLRRLSEQVLPSEFDNQRKQGFSIPLGQWLRKGPFRELFHSVLLDDGCFFNQNTIRALLQGQENGRNNGERLFGLLMFELWRKEYGITA